MSTTLNIKTRIKNGEAVFGTFCNIPSTTMIDALGYAGMDFCILDTEHGPMNTESIADLVMVANGVQVDPIVRVGKNDELLILRALDVGALGVQVPKINTKEDAEIVVDSVKYSPIGSRGLSIFTKAGSYFCDSGEDHTDKQNEKTMTIVHIEGKDAISNIDSIISVDGIDVIFLGPYDISQSLGIPGKVDDERVSTIIKEMVKRSKSMDMAVGSYAKDIDMAKWLKGLGVQYIAINVDSTIYMQACKSIVAELS